MTQTYAVIVTTINSPTRAVLDIQRGSPRLGARFVVVGDSKSPPDFHLDGADYLDLSAQRRTGFRFADLCPTRHYARKNVGYVVAARQGAEVIIETDDDNIPRDGFWTPRVRRQTAPQVIRRGWSNAYGYFSDALIWPRGLPLDQVRKPLPPLEGVAEDADCPIQQGLADENPDVDAIYRLVLPYPSPSSPTAR